MSDAAADAPVESERRPRRVLVVAALVENERFGAAAGHVLGNLAGASVGVWTAWPLFG
ncbi:hypothetical protein [Halobacterium sp. R2-5]|uniref:hypothetical protein n=1 Tax=Halobacterium sp. R2-5 TaxID=2715751 RepID=UPI001421FF09|nr:hypothetical protein [Halobacterium sp. R2-5]NIB99877.1 hypothetical protein [Halobacterium sp. R2-5]